jgi:hypothetical protein
MSRSIQVDIEEVVLEGDHGPVDGVRATCSECDHATEAFGTGPGSRKRCLALMREECEEDDDEEHWYEDSGK